MERRFTLCVACTLLILLHSSLLRAQPSRDENDDISVIELVKSGDYWTGFLTSGVGVYSPAQQTWTYYNQANTPSLLSDSITNILAHVTGGVEYVYVGSANGLASFSNNAWSTVAPLAGQHITGMVMTPGDTLWVFTANNGAFLLNSTAQTYYGNQKTGNSSIPTNNISVAQRGNSVCGSIAIGTANQGFYYTKDGTNYYHIDTTNLNGQLVDNRITSMFQSNDCSALLIGTQAGYSIYPPDARCTNYTTSNGLSQNHVTAISQDCAGKIWVGTGDSGALITQTVQNVLTNRFNYDSSGVQANALIQASNGLLYGTRYIGGTFFYGSIISFNPVTGQYLTVHSFSLADSGARPSGAIVQIDSFLYGVTTQGGAYNNGGIFKFNINSNTLTRLFDYKDTTTGYGNNNGLVAGPNGMLYGTTQNGGFYSSGVFFQFNPSNNVYTDLFDFNHANGWVPTSIVVGGNGVIYGQTEFGGASGLGVLYSYNTSNSQFTKMRDFAGGTQGSWPNGSLVLADNGLLFGEACGGGENDCGAIFMINPANDTLISVYSFDTTFNAGANNCDMSLMNAYDGWLYGTTGYAMHNGITDNGVIFKICPANYNFQVVAQFNAAAGTSPHGGLVQLSDHSMYGSTLGGGADFSGSLFQFDPVVTTFSRLTTDNGLPSNQVTFIAFNQDSCTGSGLVGTADGHITIMDTVGTPLQVINGVANISRSAMAVYLFPQPAQAQVNFVFGANVQGELNITDLFGQRVSSYKVGNQTMLSADVSQFAPGVYFYTLQREGNILTTGKILVVR